MSARELGKLIKASDPNYAGYDDEELGNLVIKNYPEQYGGYADKTLKDNVTELGGRVLQGAGDIAGTIIKSKPMELAQKASAAVADPAAKIVADVLEKLGKPLGFNETQRAEFKKITENKGQNLMSDVMTAISPEAFGAKEGDNSSAAVGKTINRMAADIIGDPLTFAQFGNATKLGRMVKLVEEANAAKQPIKLGSKLAKDIAEHMGAAKPSAKVINDFKKQFVKGGMGVGLEGQIAKGTKSLASIKVPFTDLEAGFTGNVASKAITPFNAAKQLPPVKKSLDVIRTIFSTKTGNPQFDLLASKFKDYAHARMGDVYEEVPVLQKRAEELTRELGITRDELNKAVTNYGERINPLGKKAYTKEIKDALDEHYTDRMLDYKVALVKAQKAGDQIAVDEASKGMATYNGLLNELHGHYAPVPVDPKIAAFSNDIAQANAEQLMREQITGVDVTEMLSNRNYLPHIMTPEYKQALREKWIADGRPGVKKMSQQQFDTELDNAMERQFNKVRPEVIDGWKKVGLISKKDANAAKKNGVGVLKKLREDGVITDDQFKNAVHTLSIEEVNTIPDALKESLFGKAIPGKEIFHTDPIYHTTIRGIRGEVARTSTEFMNEIKLRGIAVPSANSPPGWVKVDQAIKELNGYSVPPEVGNVLTRYKDFHSNPEALKGFLGLYDRAHSLMKAWTLYPFPAYHIKNFVGNLWNNWLAGVTNADVYRQAEFVRLGKKVAFKDVYGKDWNSQNLLRAAKDLGVIGEGQFGRDIDRTIYQILEKPKWLTLSRRNKLLHYGREFGKRVEDNARMAHFIDRLRKGDTAEEAAMSVKKFLFDYGDLTDIEKNVFNRGFFFYTWTRKNIPLQLQSLVHYPAKFTLPWKLKNEVEKNIPAPPDENHLAQWAKDSMPMRVRFNKKNNQYEYWLLNNWLPAADIYKLGHIHEIAAQMMAPIPKEIIQQIANYDFFFKKEIENHYGKTFLGKHMPARVAHVLKNIRLLNEIDKMTDEDTELFTKIQQFFLGRGYTFDPAQGAVQHTKQIEDEIGELIKAQYGNQLSKHPNAKEASKLNQRIIDKAGEF